MEELVEIIRMKELSPEVRIDVVENFEDVIKSKYGINLGEKLVAELVESLENQPPKPTEKEKFIIEYCLRNPAESDVRGGEAQKTVKKATELWKQLGRFGYLNKPTIKEIQAELQQLEEHKEYILRNVHGLNGYNDKEEYNKITKQIEVITKLLNK